MWNLIEVAHTLLYIHVQSNWLQNSSRPTRTCTKKVTNYNDNNCVIEFLQSDDEGSDFEQADSNDNDDEECEVYEADIEAAGATYDKKLGEDCWVGRRIIKSFGQHGDFDGIIYNVDQDSNKPDHRLFMVYYFEDPEDPESMRPEELVK